MRALLLCVGRLKEAYWRDAAREYEKRLARYGRFEVAEVAEGESAKEDARVRREEGERLLARVRPEDFVVALAVDGRRYDSVGFSEALHAWGANERRVVLVIGGSTGLDDAVYARADARASFSDMTFPHQLMRVIALEQVYRAMKIRAGEAYHK